MADLTFPLMMPTTGVDKSTFTLTDVTSRNQYMSGTGPGTQLAPDYWEITIEIAQSQRGTTRFRQWRSFLDAIKTTKLGLFYDSDMPRPAYYTKAGIVGMTKAGGGSFNGTAAIAAIVDNFNVTVSGLPANFILQATDYVGFVESGRYWLTRLLQDVTASNLGVATINIASELPSLFDTSATVVFEKPCCEGYLTAAPTITRDLEGGQIAFSARSRAY